MNKDKLIKNLPLIIILLFVLAPLLRGQFLLFLVFLLIIYFVYKNVLKNIPGFSNFNLKNFYQPGGEKENKDNVIDLDKINIKNINKNNFKFMQNLPQNPKKIIISAIIIIFGAWLFFASIVIVEAGETGVYSLFGKVKDEELKSGFHLVNPLAKVTKMSVRTEEYTMSVAQGEGKRPTADAITSLTKEGLSVDLDLTVLYRLVEEKASDVYKTIGLSYDEKVIRPSIRTAIRDVIAQYEAKDIYSEKREEVTTKIEDYLKNDLLDRGVLVENVLLRNVALPPNLAKAIQEKLQADQEQQKYDFILQKEEKEKERKIIEAGGQRESQRIINESLSTNYLYYLYINQLKDLEGTVYVPTSPTTGMPLFRNIGQ